MKEPKEIPEGQEICPDCDGVGEVCYSCCGGEIITGDILICPSCHEMLGEDTCETCEGTGFVPIGTPESDKIDPQARAEEMYEGER